MFKSLFNKSNTSLNTKKSVFIHIPKCGGSTFVGLLMDSDKQKEFDTSKPSHRINFVGTTEIKHVDFNSKQRFFKEPEIFDVNKYKEYKNKLLFMLFRDPVERILSEFNFQYHILNGKDGNKNAVILSKLKQRPDTIEKYIEYKETQNYQTKFLLGNPIASTIKLNINDYERIIGAIETLPIHCGITDEYASFLHLFEKETGIKLNKRVLVRKKTPFLYHLPIQESTRKRIIELNDVDYKLYNYIKHRITLNEKKFVFEQNDQFIV